MEIFLVTGVSYGNVGFGDYYTIKYNSSGVQIWSSSFTDGTPYSITVDNLNNVYVTGRSLGDFLTIKYNSNGVQKWFTNYNGPMNDNDAGEVVKVDTLGNVYVSGSSIGDMFYYDYATVKYDSLGIEQWVRRYEGSGHYMDQVNDMAIDKAGSVYVTGNSTESGQGYNMTTIKYNTYGDFLWKASYHNGPNDIAYAIALDNDGNIYVIGESDGSGTNEDYETVKYNSFGVQQWIKRYDYSGQFGDYPQAIALDNNGSVFVTGTSDRDILTVKYSQLTGAITNLSEIPTEYKLSQNYPNPFNPTTKIKFDITRDVRREMQDVKIVVYDVLGSEVVTLINESKTVGSYEVEFDATGFPSGIYFYSLLIDGNVIDTKRMILLK
ncbi:MAG: SBBP repeat-containing protein [Ignavibacteria bacterium]|nr:SBBP repeat-containing protein [Ignavibacteria bacterium]